MKLNDTVLRNAKPKEKPYKLTDGDGMFLLVKPNGGKYWRLKYRVLGKEKLLALGTYPEVSLADARAKRLEARKQLNSSIDPSQKKKDDKRLAVFKAENTLQAVAKEWYDTNLKKWTDRHADRLWRRLEIHLFPALGKRPVSEISSLELLEVLRKVEKAGTVETAHRVLQSAGCIFRHAVLTERTKHDPAYNLRRVLTPSQEKHFPTIEASELPAFFKALEAINTTDMNKLAVRLLMYTFVRTGELRQAKWEDINFGTKEWRVRPETTKMRTLHIVPLASQTIALLKELRALTGRSDFLFPSQNPRKNPMMSDATINHILHRMGYKDKLVGHGFRSLASTTLNEMGFRPDAIEMQLAHMERNKSRAAYNHAKYLDERRVMMKQWANYLEAVASGKKPQITNVITGKFGKAG